MLGSLLLSVLPFLSAALAQTSSSFTDSDNGITFQGLQDPTHGVTYGFVFPTGGDSTEFIGEIVAPVDAKWIGLALGGAMAGDLLVVAWPNGNEIVKSTRYTTGYVQPTEYDGPTLSDLPSTSVNSTHWKWVFRCQNCTSWTGGSITQTGVSVFAWAFSDVAVDDPTDPQSTFQEHTDFGLWGENIANAQSASYSSYLTSTGGSSSASGSATSTSAAAGSSSTSAGTVSKYGQCGGEGYAGSTTCVAGTTCTVSNPYYSQCL